MDSGVKHPSVHIHIYLVTTVYQILQSTYLVYRSVADSGQVGRRIIYAVRYAGLSWLGMWWQPSGTYQAHYSRQYGVMEPYRYPPYPQIVSPQQLPFDRTSMQPPLDRFQVSYHCLCIESWMWAAVIIQFVIPDVTYFDDVSAWQHVYLHINSVILWLLLKMICGDFLVVKVNCWSNVFNIIKSIWIFRNIKQ